MKSTKFDGINVWGKTDETDPILDMKVGEEEPDDSDHAVIDFEAKRKLTKLLDVVRSTERGQRTGQDLRAKQANYQMVTELLEKVRNCKSLSRTEMIFCNNTWKRYS